MNPGAGVRPSSIVAVAMQCPTQILHEHPEQLRFQAAELVDWFFGSPDPQWLPEHLFFEEVEEIVEEYVEVEEDVPFEYQEPREIFEE